MLFLRRFPLLLVGCVALFVLNWLTFGSSSSSSSAATSSHSDSDYAVKADYAPSAASSAASPSSPSSFSPSGRALHVRDDSATRVQLVTDPQQHNQQQPQWRGEEDPIADPLPDQRVEMTSPDYVEPARPNLLVISMADLGFSDLGFFNGLSPYPVANQNTTGVVTPFLDKLAAESVTLRNLFVHPFSAASKAALLTGRYPWRSGMTRETTHRPLPLDSYLLPELLAENGYDTAFVGNWDLDFGQLGHSKGFFGFNHHALFSDDDGEQKGHQQVAMQRTAEAALDYLQDREHGAEPFFLWVALTASQPWRVPASYLDQFPLVYDPSLRAYAAVLRCLDDQVAQIMGSLEYLGLKDNTLVVFTGENGGIHHPAVKIGGYRGRKFSSFDGGIRVPSFFSWPGRFPKNILEDNVMIEDFYETLLRAAEVAPTEFSPSRTNLLPALLDPTWQSEDEEMLPAEPRTMVHDISSYTASVRKGKYKLVVRAKDCLTPTGKPLEASRMKMNSALDLSPKLAIYSLFNTEMDAQERVNLLATPNRLPGVNEARDELLQILQIELEHLDNVYETDPEELQNQPLPNKYCHLQALYDEFLKGRLPYHHSQDSFVVVGAQTSDSCPRFNDVVLEKSPVAFWTFQGPSDLLADSSQKKNSLIPGDFSVVPLPRLGYPANFGLSFFGSAPAVSSRPIKLDSAFTLEMAFYLGFAEPGMLNLFSLSSSTSRMNAFLNVQIDETNHFVLLDGKNRFTSVRPLFSRHKLNYLALTASWSAEKMVYTLYVNSLRVTDFEAKRWDVSGNVHAILGQENFEYIDHVAIYDKVLSHQDLFGNFASYEINCKGAYLNLIRPARTPKVSPKVAKTAAFQNKDIPKLPQRQEVKHEGRSVLLWSLVGIANLVALAVLVGVVYESRGLLKRESLVVKIPSIDV